MKLKKVFLLVVVLFSVTVFSQTEINTKEGIRYITTSIEYAVSGTYFYKGGEPISELNTNGTGFYQQHDEPKRSMIWGLECSKDGVLKFTKGFDSIEYILYYKFTTGTSSETEEEWNKVEFSIHLNSMKMFINGERMKTFSAKTEK